MKPDKSQPTVDVWDSGTHEARPRAANRRKRVILVDDEPDIQEIVTLILEMDGYDVQCASNGEQALELLSAIPTPDLLIIDIMMPILDGWGLLAALRLNERTARIPVIVASASANREPERLGSARFMTKPLDCDRLLETVAALTRTHDAEPDPGATSPAAAHEEA